MDGFFCDCHEKNLTTDIRHILDALPDLALLVRDGKVVFCNKSGCKLLGEGPKKKVASSRLINLIDPDYHEVFSDIWKALLETGKTDFPLKMIGLDKKQHEIMFYSDSIVDADQDTVIIYGRDFSLAKRNAAALVESELSQKILKDASLSFLCICDENGINYINPAGLRLLGGDSEKEVLGRNFSELVHPDYHPILKDNFNVIAAEKDALPLKLVGLRGTELRVEMLVSKFRHGGRDGFLIEAKDINDLLLQQEELLRIQGVLKRKVAERTQELSQEVKARMKAQKTVEHMTFHDGLTGLGNRMQFVHYVDQEVIIQADLKKDGEKKHWAVLVLDLDHFKDLNLLRVIFPAACGVLWRDERVYTQES